MEKITNKKLNEMLTEDERSGRDCIDYIGIQNGEDGFAYSVWKDTRSGTVYGVREVRTVHMGFNDSPPEKIEELKRVIDREGVARASWGVTGRTCHMALAYELQEKMTGYAFKIGYNYECEVTKD